MAYFTLIVKSSDNVNSSDVLTFFFLVVFSFGTGADGGASGIAVRGIINEALWSYVRKL